MIVLHVQRKVDLTEITILTDQEVAAQTRATIAAATTEAAVLPVASIAAATIEAAVLLVASIAVAKVVADLPVLIEVAAVAKVVAAAANLQEDQEETNIGQILSF